MSTITPAPLNRAKIPARSSLKRAAEIIMLAGVVCALAMVASYGLLLRNTAEAGDMPTTAVVFTGQFDRIDKGLALMEAGEISRLFISGVNGGAGLNPSTFAQQFRLSAALQAQLKAGNIILALEAQDTLENGCETARWLVQQPNVGSVLLITSRPHMPRATLALGRATEFRLQIERLSVDAGDYDVTQTFLAEFLKYAKTLLVSLFPEALWPDDRSGVCQRG